eukprot:3334117-Rhodomonas_salina.1
MDSERAFIHVDATRSVEHAPAPPAVLVVDVEASLAVNHVQLVPAVSARQGHHHFNRAGEAQVQHRLRHSLSVGSARRLRLALGLVRPPDSVDEGRDVGLALLRETHGRLAVLRDHDGLDGRGRESDALERVLPEADVEDAAQRERAGLEAPEQVAVEHECLERCELVEGVVRERLDAVEGEIEEPELSQAREDRLGHTRDEVAIEEQSFEVLERAEAARSHVRQIAPAQLERLELPKPRKRRCVDPTQHHASGQHKVLQGSVLRDLRRVHACDDVVGEIQTPEVRDVPQCAWLDAGEPTVGEDEDVT